MQETYLFCVHQSICMISESQDVFSEGIVAMRNDRMRLLWLSHECKM